ncbi:hypothetical protein C8F01DRAFT_1295455 [Mycena amicta]|nr:hypothetical protein C8F01DRAFT_1295455 [Mycena amicta]
MTPAPFASHWQPLGPRFADTPNDLQDFLLDFPPTSSFGGHWTHTRHTSFDGPDTFQGGAAGGGFRMRDADLVSECLCGAALSIEDIVNPSFNWMGKILCNVCSLKAAFDNLLHMQEHYPAHISDDDITESPSLSLSPSPTNTPLLGMFVSDSSSMHQGQLTDKFESALPFDRYAPRPTHPHPSFQPGYQAGPPVLRCLYDFCLHPAPMIHQSGNMQQSRPPGVPQGSHDSPPIAKERECSNCHTQKTGRWRRPALTPALAKKTKKTKKTKKRLFLCNACGLYERNNGTPRPCDI